MHACTALVVPERILLQVALDLQDMPKIRLSKLRQHKLSIVSHAQSAWSTVAKICGLGHKQNAVIFQNCMCHTSELCMLCHLLPGK